MKSMQTEICFSEYFENNWQQREKSTTPRAYSVITIRESIVIVWYRVGIISRWKEHDQWSIHTTNTDKQ